MKLYYFPGACSLSPHIVAREAGLSLELVKVHPASQRTASGADFLAISPKGYVPVLELDDGQLLTEGPVIVQYLSDLAKAELVPAAGTMERYRQQEMLGYINSELHKSYGPLFNRKTPVEVRDERVAYLKKRYALIEQQLNGKSYLFGEHFSAADAYLYTVTRWAALVKLDLSEFPNLMAFQTRVSERPHVREALIAEGLQKVEAS